ncbi:MAG: hypothetical protein ACXV7J_06200 [Methylomonas sp.]
MNTRINAAMVLLLASIAATAIAEPVNPVTVPEKVSANILKRHPDAQELQASYESHFGFKLLEVAFKTGSGEPMQELFTLTGHLFTSEQPMASLSGLSPAASEALSQQFPNFQLKKAEQVTNPNGVGEEYELYLHAGGIDWKILINDKGKITQKDQLS